MTNEANEEKKQKRKLPLSEGLIIAASSVIAYLFAFIYEAGFAKIFDIPLHFVTLSLTNVFITGGSLLLISLTLFILADLIFVIFVSFLKSDSPIYRRLVKLAPMVFFSIALLFFQINTALQAGLKGLIASWLLIAFFEFGFPLITQRHKASYRDKLEAQDQLVVQRETLRDYAVGLLGEGLYRTIYFLSLALVVTYVAGQSTALRQREFLVTATSPEMAVLRMYGDKMICAPFDRSTGEVERSFTVLRIAEDSGLTLHLERVGPLNPREETTNATPSPIATPTPSPMLSPKLTPQLP